jgi:membrane associated rhomboid family serine protease
VDIFNEIKRTFKEGSALTRLIYINLAVFLLIKIMGVIFYLAGQNFNAVEWLMVPSDLTLLAGRPWTPVSYMFLHAGFLHLLFNILGLYWFGKLFLYHFEGDKLWAVYLLGGISGAFLYVAAFNIFPAFTGVRGFLLGASASVMAILTATAFYDPDREIHLFFIGRFPLKYVAVFYVVLSVIGISASNPGGNVAHLGGAAWGWFYIYELRRGKDLGSWLISMGDKVKKFFNNGQKMKVSFKQSQSPPRDDYEYNRQKNIQQEEINRILDKIAESGYESLTKKEKEILFKQGKN